MSIYSETKGTEIEVIWYPLQTYTKWTAALLQQSWNYHKIIWINLLNISYLRDEENGHQDWQELSPTNMLKLENVIQQFINMVSTEINMCKIRLMGLVLASLLNAHLHHFPTLGEPYEPKNAQNVKL